MKVCSILENRRTREDFVRFGVAFPATFPYLMPRPYHKESALLDEGRNFFFRNGIFDGWVTYEAGEASGRIAAMINPDMCSDRHKLGTVGLYEAVDCYETASALLNTATDFLRNRGCTHVWGPVDFTIWHGYRFKTDAFREEAYLGEPQNPDYYPRQFMHYGFAPIHTWESHVRGKATMEQVFNEFRPDYDLSLKVGFSYEKIDPNRSESHVNRTRNLMMDTYGRFPGLSPISTQDFLSLYESMRVMLDTDASSFLKDPDGADAGFILVMKDLATALESMSGGTSLSAGSKCKLKGKQQGIANFLHVGIKRAAIKRAARAGRNHGGRLSIGKALAHRALMGVLESGRYDGSVQALIHTDAPTRNYVQDRTTQVRHYQLYEVAL